MQHPLFSKKNAFFLICVIYYYAIKVRTCFGIGWNQWEALVFYTLLSISVDSCNKYQLWINSILFQGACNVGRELAWGFDVLPCRDCGSWNSRLLRLELWFWGKPGFCPQNFFAQVRTVFFDTLNLDLSLFSPCLSTWATSAGLEFFGETLDAEDLMAYLHLSGDSKFGVVFDTISPKCWNTLYSILVITRWEIQCLQISSTQPRTSQCTGDHEIELLIIFFGEIFLEFDHF